MSLATQQELMRPNYAAIFEALKKSGGMTVGELAKELKMSYMGVKGICLRLVELGYLREWRIPREKKEVGRPEKMYLLTSKCDELFPEVGIGLARSILEGVKQIYGEAAPEKMLYHHFQALRDEWLPQVSKGGSLRERVLILVKLREKAGWMNQMKEDAAKGVWIEEFHNPLAKIYEIYPKVERMEILMLEQVLGDRIERVEINDGKGRARVILEVPALKAVWEGAESSSSKEAPHDLPVSQFGQGELF